MIDLSYFQNQNSNVQGFFNGGTWQTWVKPRGAKMVNIFCVGSGAGGGGGYQSASTPRAGGGGGGTGATSRLTINANLLPDIIYILPGIGGIGGLGGTTATSGSSGQSTFVCLIPDTTSISNIILRSGTIPSVGGAAGTTVSSPGGAGETVNLITNNIFANLGVFTFQAGGNGSQGGTANGSGINPAYYIVGGTGGGGTGTSGASLLNGVFPRIEASSANVSGVGGIILYKPMLMLFGGQGGGGSTSGNGGNGGNGAPGAGGGGGGASTNTGVNAGNGGNGGDGFVIITTTF